MGQKISVVIPTARRADLLRECLESLRRQTLSDFETVLVSDGAGDWAGRLADEYGCRLLSLSAKRGFAAAVNAGVAGGQSQYVALLNDDVRLSPDWLQLTSSLLDERPDMAFCCGKIYRADGSVLDDAGDALSLAGAAWRLGHGRKDTGDFDRPRPVLAFPGTAALLRRSLLERLGGLDEDFFAYLEDMDFSLRVARQGERGFYLPQAKSFHWGGATSGGPESPEVFRYLTQNQLLILVKHYPSQLWLRLWPRIAWSQLLWAAMALRKNRLGAYAAGVSGFLRLLPQSVRKQRPWQPERRREFVARLRESEREIYVDTCAPDRDGRDAFWRMYFFLFRPKNEGTENRKEGIKHATG
jgi:GT2 family glycosyltransferase